MLQSCIMEILGPKHFQCLPMVSDLKSGHLGSAVVILIIISNKMSFPAFMKISKNMLKTGALGAEIS